MKSNYSLNLTYKFMPCRIYKLDFQEKNLNLDRDFMSARLEIWTSVVQIPIQVQIFLLKI